MKLFIFLMLFMSCNLIGQSDTYNGAYVMKELSNNITNTVEIQLLGNYVVINKDTLEVKKMFKYNGIFDIVIVFNDPMVSIATALFIDGQLIRLRLESKRRDTDIEFIAYIKKT